MNINNVNITHIDMKNIDITNTNIKEETKFKNLIVKIWIFKINIYRYLDCFKKLEECQHDLGEFTVESNYI